MTQEHPIAPPPELIRKWNADAVDAPIADKRYIAIQAARWGSDQELEACCANMHTVYGKGQADWLRSMRRPKPPSLKEQALALVEQHEDGWRPSPKDWDTIRRALESLPE